MVLRETPASCHGLDYASNGNRRPPAVNAFQDILVFVVVAPGFIFGMFALLWLLGWVPSERLLSWITGLTFAACTSGVAALVWKIASAPSITVIFGNWFAVGSYRFPSVLTVDRL